MILAPTLLLNAGSGAAIARPTFSRDFAGEKTLNNGTGPAITFTRASNATFFDANGTLQTAANDTPRFDHDPAAGALSRGLLIEEARTNSIRNSQAGGSTNGVIGSGGVMPTNWATSGAANSVSTEIIGTGTEGGLLFLDVKVSGTPTANGTLFIYFEGFGSVVAANGQTWTNSAYYKLAAGSVSNASVVRGIAGRTSLGAGVVGQGSQPSFAPSSSALNSQRQSVTFTFTDATVERVLPYCGVVYTNGNPIDLTLRIAAPQLEQGAFATSYIPTTTAAATRAADSAVVTPIASFYNQAEGTLFAEGFPTQGATATTSHLLSVGNSSSEYLSLVRLTSGATARGYNFNSPDLLADLNGGSFTASGKLAMAAKENDFAFSFNGGTVATDTSGTMPSADRMRIGSRVDTGAILNGHIRKISYWPRRLSNTLLQQLTT
jgi:hypothetical protein